MKTVKRNDVILFLSIILVGAILLSVISLIFMDKGQTVVIKINGEEYQRLPLNKDTEHLIKSEWGENLLIIKDGSAYIKSASCPQQICVKHGNLSELSPIVCKHNRVSITLE